MFQFDYHETVVTPNVSADAVQHQLKCSAIRAAHWDDHGRFILELGQHERLIISATPSIEFDALPSFELHQRLTTPVN